MSCGSIPGNLVVNCGFETGSLPPWTVNSSFFNTRTFFVHTGTYCLAMQNSVSPGTISQVIPTVPGATYKLSYWFLSTIDTNNNSFSASWDGITIPGSIIIDTSTGDVYVNYTFSGLIATTSNTVLSFSQFNDGFQDGLDDVSVVLTNPPCYSGKSKIHSKNIQTSEIANIDVSEILSNTHKVYNIDEQKFITVKYNIVTGPTTRYMKIPKDALGENQPSEDFYVTSGHKLIIDGKEIKAGKILQAKRVKVKPENVYTIVTEEHVPILVNNLAVMTYGYDEWLEYSKKRGIVWHNNKIE